MRTFAGLSCYRLLACLLAALPPSPVTAQAPDTQRWARVLSVRGPVVVETSGAQRELGRGDSLRTGDVLVTGRDGFVQVRAWDGAEIELMQDARLRLQATTAPGAGGPAAGSAQYTLQQGGLRMRSGSAATVVDTPLGRLEAAGSFECLQEHELNCAVNRGSLAIHNARGSLRLGQGGNFDYALVANAGSRPLGLLSIPPPLDPGAAATLNSSQPVLPDPAGRQPSAAAGPLPGASAFPEPAPIVVQPQRR